MKSFIIHLPKIKSSYESALNVKKSLDNFNMENELFEGSYGNIVAQDYKQKGRCAHPWGLKGPDNLFPKEYRNRLGTNGEKGCFDSHYRLWQKCIELNESILIFEDDVLLIRPYEKVEWVDVLSVAFSHRKKMWKYKSYLENPKGIPEAKSYRQSTMPGLGGYAIHPHAAKKLVKEYKDTFLPADNAINCYLVKIQIHSHMMGRALNKNEGNISLIRGKSSEIWSKI